MNNTTKIIIAIISIIILSLLINLYAKSDNHAMMTSEKSGSDSAMMMKDDGTATKTAMMADDQMATGTMMKDHMSAGSYEAYAPEKIAKAATGKVVLFFRAGWCPTCRAVDSDIKAHLGKIPENVTILDVDYDKASELKKKYGVTYQHTFVQVSSDGTMIKKWSGSPTLSELISQIQ